MKNILVFQVTDPNSAYFFYNFKILCISCESASPSQLPRQYCRVRLLLEGRLLFWEVRYTPTWIMCVQIGIFICNSYHIWRDFLKYKSKMSKKKQSFIYCFREMEMRKKWFFKEKPLDKLHFEFSTLFVLQDIFFLVKSQGLFYVYMCKKKMICFKLLCHAIYFSFMNIPLSIAFFWAYSSSAQ